MLRYLIPAILFSASACDARVPEYASAVGARVNNLDPAFQRELAAIEKQSGGRLGVALLDAKGRLLLENRSNERFAMCSTFKLPLAAMLLEAATAGTIDPARTVAFDVADLPDHSPDMLAHARDGRGSIELSRAAYASVVFSDNGAANAVLDALGGPAALTARLRAWGDDATRLDRAEPALNQNAKGDPRDTTSPAAMAGLMRRIVVGELLNATDGGTLMGWLTRSETGKARIRAALPADYRAGDKTGSCGDPNPAYNDIAWFQPGDAGTGAAHVLAVYLDRPARGGDQADAAIAKVAELALRRIAADR